MNFCTNCGKRLVAGDYFCRHCGARIDIVVDKAGKPDKRRRASARNGGHKKLIAVLAAVLVLALGAGTVFGFPYIRNTVVKNTMSPNKYLNYVMDDLTADLADSISAYTERMREGLDQDHQTESSIEVAIGDQALDYAQRLSGEYLGDEAEIIDWAQKIRLSATQYSDGNNIGIDADVKINDKHIAQCSVAASLNNGDIYVSLPEVNQTPLMTRYIRYDLPQNIDYSIIDNIPKKDVVRTLIHDYLMTVIEGVDDVRKENTGVTVGAQSQKCTALVATVDVDNAVDIAKIISDKLKNDETLEGIIKDFSADLGNDPDYIYSSFLNEIDYLYNELESEADYNSSDDAAVITIWVNGKGDVIGANFKIDGREYVRYLNIVNGKEFASEFKFDVDGERLNLRGEGKISGIKCDGYYKLSYNDEDILSAQIEEVNVLKLKQGYFEGTVTVQPGSRVTDELSYSCDPSVLSRSQLKLESLKSNEKESKGKLTLIFDNSDIISITNDFSKKGSKKAVDLPVDYIRVDDYDGYEAWMSQSNFNTLFDNLTDAGAHGEWLDELRGEVSWY